MSHQFLDFKLIEINDIADILQKCEGNRNNGIFICATNLNQDSKDFLSKILSAVKLDLQKDVLVLEKTPDDNFSFGALIEQVPLQKAIIFGASPTSIGLHVNFKPYQPFTLSNCTFLFADDLSKIAQNQQLKKLLWAALKGLFS